MWSLFLREIGKSNHRSSFSRGQVLQIGNGLPQRRKEGRGKKQKMKGFKVVK